MAARRGSALAVVLLATVVLVACTVPGAAQPHTTLQGSLEPLRARFEADAGKVRAIFLASPT